MAQNEDVVAHIHMAFPDAAEAAALAQRCVTVLRRHGVRTLPDDWSVLERAGDRHCWEVLSDIAAAEKLTAVQTARLRLVLSGQNTATDAPSVAVARDSFRRLAGGAGVAGSQERLRWPLLRMWRAFSLPAGPLEVMFVATNRPTWYRAIFDATLDGDRLREAVSCISEVYLITAALLMGGLLTLVSFDLSRPQTPATPLNVICLSVNLFAFLFAFCSVLLQLYTLHIYLPVPSSNLRDVVRSTRSLPMTSALFFAISAWGIFIGLILESMRPLEGVDFWLFRLQELGPWARATPIFSLLACFTIICIPFFVQVSGAARLVAHAGALAEARVLPPEAASWPADAAKRAMTAVALRNPDLKKLYAHRNQRAVLAEDARPHAGRKRPAMLGLHRRAAPPPARPPPAVCTTSLPACEAAYDSFDAPYTV